MRKYSRIVVTGGTGSIGSLIIEMLRRMDGVEKIISLSRREEEISFALMHRNDPRVEYRVCDLLDYHLLSSNIAGADLVIHCAAMKYVDVCSFNVWPCIQVNLAGSNNVLMACQEHGAEVILTSTDKAVEPLTTMGCTKFLMEKLGQEYAKKCPQMNVRIARFGNVFGSYGSVVHKFYKRAITNQPFPITDAGMTRFIITPYEVQKVYSHLMSFGESGDIASYRMRIMRVTDLHQAFQIHFRGVFDVEEVGVRPEEKMHETIFTEKEWQQVKIVNDVIVCNEAIEGTLPDELNRSELAEAHTAQELAELLPNIFSTFHYEERIGVSPTP